MSLIFLSLFWPSLIYRWRIHFREARLRDLDLDDSRKRGHVDVHLEFLHSSNSPPPTAASSRPVRSWGNYRITRFRSFSLVCI